MTQRHRVQEGIFHVTTVTKNRMPWCEIEGVSDIILDNLLMTKNLQKAKIYAFCILLDHMHFYHETRTKWIELLYAFIQTKQLKRHRIFST